MNLIFQDVVPSDSGQYECQVQLLQNQKYFSGCQNWRKGKMLKLGGRKKCITGEHGAPSQSHDQPQGGR